MKQKIVLTVMILAMLVGSLAYGQSMSYYPDWRTKRSAELEGGSHTPITYQDTETLVPGTTLYTGWMLLGWNDNASATDQDFFIHVTPANWSIVLGLAESGLGDSVGVGSCRYELALDTTQYPIWSLDSVNVFLSGLTPVDTGSAVAQRWEIPLGIGIPAYGRLVFEPATDLTDTVLVDWSLIGTNKPTNAFSVYQAKTTGTVVSGSLTVSNFPDSSHYRKTISVDDMPAITGTVGISNFSTMTPIMRDSQMTEFTGVDSAIILSPALGNVTGDIRLCIIPDTITDVSIGWAFEDQYGSALSQVKVCYVDTSVTQTYSEATYVKANDLNLLAGYPYWAILYDAETGKPMPTIPIGTDKLRLYVTKRTEEGTLEFISYIVWRKQ